MADYLGSFDVGSTLRFFFTTHAQTGATVAPNSAFEAADIRIYKNGSDTQRTSESGYTMTSPFDSVTGLHAVAIDLSDNTHAGFYAAGSEYAVILVPDETIDGLATAAVLAYFSIERVGKANVTQLGGDAQSATDLKDFADAGYDPATNKVQGVVLVDTLTTYTGNTPQTADHTAAIADLPTNAELATALGTADDAVLTAISDLPTNAELATALAAADDAILSAINDLPTNAELATALGTADDAVLAQVALVKAKTDLIPASPAAVGDIPIAATIAAAVLTTAMTESYAADGAAPTPAQALFLIQQVLTDFVIIGTTYTVRKVDGSTTAATLTLNDATSPTGAARAT